MGIAHKVISACLRVFEFCLATVILGILARFFNVLHQLNAPDDSRLVFALSMAAISMAFTIILVPPVKYSFHFFPLDFCFFILWIVCYALLQDLAGGRSCSSSWYTSYWSVYWSGSQAVVTSPGCSRWRVVLAFSFIIAFFWFTSGVLGAYACFEYYSFDKKCLTIARYVFLTHNHGSSHSDGG
ncbi:hypothetical protein GE09DRAFT_571755 [Coniochaeta sp. 2T2.1]|nr:hypothetical protein GE09DRAFT_571755 [Coniochaeta sp. 2T2.1]